MRIDYLLSRDVSFAIETTLATKSYVNLVKKAQAKRYQVKLLFFWLNSPELAIKRVAERVLNGGHNIPEEVIRRRYINGINNLFHIFADIVDYWEIYDNSTYPAVNIATGGKEIDTTINELSIYKNMISYVK